MVDKSTVTTIVTEADAEAWLAEYPPETWRPIDGVWVVAHSAGLDVYPSELEARREAMGLASEVEVVFVPFGRGLKKSGEVRERCTRGGLGIDLCGRPHG